MNPDVAYRRRWSVLAVLSSALLVVGMDNTILNVALPTMQRELAATSGQLQWIVDAYTLVFAGLILVAGSWGDRRGRRLALLIGLAIFAAASAWGASADTVGELTAARAVMGIGGALIMPATLSILTTVFTDPTERKTAIGIWAGVSGLGIAIGPSFGGWLLEHFWWGSVFLINVPFALMAFGLALWLVPESKDADAPRLDVAGAVLSIVALSLLVFAIIEAPLKGWSAPEVLLTAGLGAAAVAGFIAVERRVSDPMLDLTLFANPRFGVPAAAVAVVFFALFGTVFFLAIYLQAVLGYDALEAGLRMLPLAIGLAVGSPLAMAMAKRTGEKWPTVLGMAMLAASFVIISTTTVESDYWPQVPLQMTLMAFGIAFAMAPATEAVMAAVPSQNAGIGAGVNDAVRQVGGAFGVAVLGSVLNASYATRVTDDLGPTLQALPADAAASVEDSLQGAFAVAQSAPPEIAGPILDAARLSFVEAMDFTALLAAGAVVVATVITARYMPSWATPLDGAVSASDPVASEPVLPEDVAARR